MLLTLALVTCIYVYGISNGAYVKASNGKEYWVNTSNNDYKKAANMIGYLHDCMALVVNKMVDKYKNTEHEHKVNRMRYRFANCKFSETITSTYTNLTSYVINKRDMRFCIRDKHTNKIHDKNILTFVALHELGHLMDNGHGHDNDRLHVASQHSRHGRHNPTRRNHGRVRHLAPWHRARFGCVVSQIVLVNI